MFVSYKSILKEKDKQIEFLLDEISYLKKHLDSFIAPPKVPEYKDDPLNVPSDDGIQQALQEEVEAAKMLTGELIEI